jgi:hypothetical protein
MLNWNSNLSKFAKFANDAVLTLEQHYKIEKKCTTNVLKPCLQMAIVSSLKITKKTNTDNQIQLSHWLGKKSLGPHTTLFCWTLTTIHITFHHFYWSFQIFTNLPNPITHLTVTSLKSSQVKTTQEKKHLDHQIQQFHWP